MCGLCSCLADSSTLRLQAAAAAEAEAEWSEPKAATATARVPAWLRAKKEKTGAACGQQLKIYISQSVRQEQNQKYFPFFFLPLLLLLSIEEQMTWATNLIRPGSWQLKERQITGCLGTKMRWNLFSIYEWIALLFADSRSVNHSFRFMNLFFLRKSFSLLRKQTWLYRNLLKVVIIQGIYISKIYFI